MDFATFTIEHDLKGITSVAKADKRIKATDLLLHSYKSKENPSLYYITEDSVKFHKKLKIALLKKRDELMKIENIIIEYD